ncbi:MAG: biopolymer transport protein ExbB [Campylobacterota bacterium]|nr:biopolymer transport protein ExbB [Campylobacterota bacterium]
MKLLLLLAMLLTLNLSANEEDLQRAYAKEFAYLKAQKEMLQKRVQEIKEQNAKSLSDAQSDIATLQNSVLAKGALSEKLSDDLYKAQQSFQTIEDDATAIESVVLQAQSTLKPHGVEISVDKEKYKDTLGEIFAKTDTLIKDLSSLRVEKGLFYAKDGKEVEGEIIKVGNIANYGISPSLSGALVSAGDNKFKIYSAADTSKSAASLKNRENGAPIDIFIYENASKEIEDVHVKTLVDVIDDGGIIGWVTVALGIFALLLALLRTLFLFSASSSTDTLAKMTLEKLLGGGVESALEFLKVKKGSTARLLKATVRNLDRDREHIEDIVSESILHESSRLDKFGSFILVIAAVAPLLGLLGTVTGMIATFDIITEFGTGDPKLLSSGISIALVTTELGLIVAIPLIMIGNLLGGWAERIKDHMEHSALHLINEYNKQK